MKLQRSLAISSDRMVSDSALTLPVEEFLASRFSDEMGCLDSWSEPRPLLDWVVSHLIFSVDLLSTVSAQRWPLTPKSSSCS